MRQTNNEKAFELAQYAFRFNKDQKTQNRFNFLLDHSKHYASFDGEILASQAIATPLKIQFFQETFDMMGIGFVSSDPSYRGEGRIDQLMRKILQDCRENNVLFSYLAPFSYPFYRRYGYELIFERIAYQVPSQEWPDSPKVTGYVRRKPWTACQSTIKKLYQSSSKNKHGGVQREDWWLEYKYHLPESFDFAIYYNSQDNAQGYLIYQVKDGIFSCVEWVFLTGEAYKGLNRYIASHKDSTKEIHYEHGYDKNNHFFLQTKPLSKASIRPEMMARIVDVEAFLEVYPFENVEKPFAIVIEEDLYAPWNQGVFEIDQSGIVSKVDTTKLPKLTTDVQRFTQLFLGYQSIEELSFHELIQIDTEIGPSIAKILPTQVPVLEDYF